MNTLNGKNSHLTHHNNPGSPQNPSDLNQPEVFNNSIEQRAFTSIQTEATYHIREN